MNRRFKKFVLNQSKKLMRRRRVNEQQQNDIRRVIGLSISDGKPLWERDTSMSWIVYGGAGSSKTIAVAVPSVLSVLADHDRGVWINDIKGEVAWQLGDLCCKYGRKFAVIASTNSMGKDYPYRVSVNVLDNIIRAYLNNSPNLLLEIIKAAEIFVPEPPRPDANHYWRQSQRELFILAVLILLEQHPDLLTMGAVATLLADPTIWESAVDIAAEEGEILTRNRAEQVKKLRENRDSDHYSHHMLGILSAVQLYAEGGPLHEVGRNSDITVAELIKQKYIVCVVGNKNTASELKVDYGLTFNNLLSTQMEGGCGKTLLVLDEAAATPARELFEKVVLFRSSGLQIIYIAQSRSDLRRRLGDHLVATVEDNCCHQYLQVNNFEESDRLSKILGEIDNVGYSLNDTSNKVGLSRTINLGRERLFPADKLRALPRSRQIILIPGLSPIECEKVYQNNLGPYAYDLAPNPEEGGVLEPDIKVNLPTNLGSQS